MKAKNLFLLGITCLILGACSFHSKQPVDDTYYKKTQSVAWPDGKSSTSTKSTTTSASKTGYDSSKGATPELNWQDPKAENTRQVAIPAMPEKKLQCVKTDRDTYTCRLGQYQCGTGCKSDGSNCYRGYCLQSDCDDVMGQKWDLVYQRSDNLYYCQHPTKKVSCRPDGNSGIHCWGTSGYSCGWQCNKNGTQCAEYHDNCWAQYRDV